MLVIPQVFQQWEPYGYLEGDCESWDIQKGGFEHENDDMEEEFLSHGIVVLGTHV